MVFQRHVHITDRGQDLVIVRVKIQSYLCFIMARRYKIGFITEIFTSYVKPGVTRCFWKKCRTDTKHPQPCVNDMFGKVDTEEIIIRKSVYETIMLTNKNDVVNDVVKDKKQDNVIVWYNFISRIAIVALRNQWHEPLRMVLLLARLQLNVIASPL